MVNVRGGLSVDEPSGERWELALELLGAGGEAIAIGKRRTSQTDRVAGRHRTGRDLDLHPVGAQSPDTRRVSA